MNRIRSDIAAMQAYVPGFQPSPEEHFIKLNTNENPYPPSPKVVAAIQAEAARGLQLYPDARSRAAREAAGRVYGFDPEWIIMANGSDEVLNNLIRCCAAEGEQVGYLHPSYSYYATLARIQGAVPEPVPLDVALHPSAPLENFAGKIFFLTNPNAPFGFAFSLDFIDELAGKLKGMLVIDEAYADFAGISACELVRRHENLVVTRTFSKSYSLAGMRIGLAIAQPEIIAALDKIRDHYNLDRLAQVAAAAALEDQETLRANVERICATRDWFAAELRTLGYEVLPSHTNFLFCTPPRRDGERICRELFARHILVRHFSDPALCHGLRISIGSREDMETTLAALRELQ
jgi:histidinol-phosphate aminotransferase